MLSTWLNELSSERSISLGRQLLELASLLPAPNDKLQIGANGFKAPPAPDRGQIIRFFKGLSCEPRIASLTFSGSNRPCIGGAVEGFATVEPSFPVFVRGPSAEFRSGPALNGS